MRYLLALLLFTGSVQADAPSITYRHACVKNGVVLEIKATKPGTVYLMIPIDLCGEFV